MEKYKPLLAITEELYRKEPTQRGIAFFIRARADTIYGLADLLFDTIKTAEGDNFSKISINERKIMEKITADNSNVSTRAVPYVVKRGFLDQEQIKADLERLRFFNSIYPSINSFLYIGSTADEGTSMDRVFLTTKEIQRDPNIDFQRVVKIEDTTDFAQEIEMAKQALHTRLNIE